jgi:Ser/Thr protein kinase RdoA (MazF antagonist)
VVTGSVLGSGLATDPALPWRDVLLDPAAVAARLAPTVGRIDACELVRVKYRVGESLRVLHRLRTGFRTQLVAARMFRGVLPPPDGAGIRHADVDTVWWVFPHDRRLRGLDALLAPPPDLARLLPGGPWRGSVVVAYAPERSVTVRAHDGGPGTVGFVKVAAPGTVDVAALAGRYRHVATGLARGERPVSVPAATGFSVRHDALALAAAPGVSWRQLARHRQPAAMELLGAGLAALHGLPLDGPAARGLRTFGRLAPSRVENGLAVVARARPDVAAAAARLASALAAARPPEDPPVLLHGDCHPGNALFDGERLALIDIDQAGIGQAGADIGSLLALLHSDAILGTRRAGRPGELAAALLAGYATVAPLPSPTSLFWHTAAALAAERAVRAVNHIDEPALARLGDLLHAAEHTLTTGARR